MYLTRYTWPRTTLPIFFIARPPPRSTLFPTRRSSDLEKEQKRADRNAERDRRRSRELLAVLALRSEEHTSELQSRPHLVCRLLLEKKKMARARSRAPYCAARRLCASGTCE